MAPEGAGPAREAGDSRQPDLPRPPARLRWRNSGATGLGSAGAAPMPKRGAGSGARHLARPRGSPCRARAPDGGGDGRGPLAPIQAGWTGRASKRSEQSALGGLHPQLPRSWRPGSAWRAGAGPTIPPGHIRLPFPEPQPPARGPARGRTPGLGSQVLHPAAGTLPGTRKPLVPRPSTHCLRDEGAWELSRRCRCRGRSWRGKVGSSCRHAGSCPCKTRPQVSHLHRWRNEPPASQSSIF